jgi:hypothetical protein
MWEAMQRSEGHSGLKRQYQWRRSCTIGRGTKDTLDWCVESRASDNVEENMGG